MERHMTTTAFEIAGYRTVKTLGVVRGLTVRSRSVFGTIGGSLQTLFGAKRHAKRRSASSSTMLKIWARTRSLGSDTMPMKFCRA